MPNEKGRLKHSHNLCRETYDKIVDDYDEVTVELRVNLKKVEHTE